MTNEVVAAEPTRALIASRGGKDVSDEMYRTYFFPNNQQVRVENPAILYVSRKEGGDSHRIATSDGIGVYIPQGWLKIEWKVKPGREVVAF